MVWQMNLRISSNVDFRNAVNLFHIPWEHCLRRGFHFCIQHFEHALEGFIIDDRKWPIALEDPAWNEILKFGLVVCWSLCIVGDAVGWIDNLAFAGFDMVERFIVESSSHLRVRTMEGFLTIHKDKICPNKFEIYMRHINWYLTTPLSIMMTGVLKWQ